MSGDPNPAPGRHSLGELSRRFRPGLMAFFLRRVGGRAEAEDLTQEVFVRLADMDARHLQSVEAYLFRMAANLLRDRARRQKVRSDYRDEIAAHAADVETRDPLRITASQESLSVLTAALRELPERTRAIFVLYRLENVDKRDICRAFQISASSLERHLARAMAYLTSRVWEDR